MGRQESTRLVCFPPFARTDARALVLGSLPGAESLRRGEYYAHPRNAFWPIMGILFGASPELNYAARVRGLLENRIALWDVCAAACRPGSSDSDLAEVVPNDFNAFFTRHPHIELVCLNGAKAHAIYARRVVPTVAPKFAAIRRERLPSTSPAHAGLPFTEKLHRWREVLDSVLRAVPVQSERLEMQIAAKLSADS